MRNSLVAAYWKLEDRVIKLDFPMSSEYKGPWGEKGFFGFAVYDLATSEQIEAAQAQLNAPLTEEEQAKIQVRFDEISKEIVKAE
jgi:hypothetical protein